ncbi:sulfatase [Verrucomicrobiota bacterium]|nr:sulfatase [Verrucomicrobiota bacterium]
MQLPRRTLLKTVALGFPYLALTGLAARAAAPPQTPDARPQTLSPLSPKHPHFDARAKRIIFLCMNGGPSHVDMFDYKPRLTTDSGKTITTPRGGSATLLGSPWKFTRHGQSGHWISSLFPNLARHADDLCFVHSMQTDVPAHPQAFLQLHTGSFQFVRPSLGAWSLYGLGTVNENLPGFITLNPTQQNGGAQNYGSSFLPAIYQGTRIGSEGRSLADARVQNIASQSLTPAGQRAQLDLIQSLNRAKLQRDQLNPQVEGVIESYELAFRMQAEVPRVMDLSSESAVTQKLYGLGDDSTDNFGRQCLLARRFIEAGVRFVEISHGNWDQHRDLESDHARHAAAVDQPIAALLTDLKQRGLLKDTLVLWSGEFGRTPYAQGRDGRDHNHQGFTLWMAGGGVKPGLSYGATDDIGATAVENKVHIHDLHATLLHLLGLDHEKLTFRHAGRDFRLTDVHGNVVKALVA